MIHFGWAIGALLFGGFIGLFIASACSVSAQADKEEEERRLKESDCFNR